MICFPPVVSPCWELSLGASRRRSEITLDVNATTKPIKCTSDEMRARKQQQKALTREIVTASFLADT